MSKNKNISKLKTSFNLNAGIIMFSLIFIYLFINIVIYFATERTNYYEVISGSNAEEINKTYTGIAIRDEKIFYSKSAGYIDYYIRENSRISKNTTLYSIDTTGELDSLLVEISEENSELTDENLSTISGLLHDFSNNYDEMDFSQVYEFKSNLKGTMVDLINMNSLKKLAKKSGDEFSINKSESTGIVLYRVDNYETIKPKKITMEDFNQDNYQMAHFSSGDKVDANAPIYKTVNDEEWSIAIPLSDSDIEKFTDKTGITIKFLKDNVTTTANFKIIKGADKNKYGIITLSKYMVRYATDRYLNLQIVDNVTSGFKIPKSSIVTKKLFIIPKEYGLEGDHTDDTVGFRLKTIVDGVSEEKFLYPTVTYSDEENYYVSQSYFKTGDIILDPYDKTYVIGKTKAFKGVYNINNGYTMFMRIKITDTTDEYYIVESESNYGLENYDRIVLDASTVKENQIVYQ